MRNPSAVNTHGSGKSRSKLLHKRSIKNQIKQHVGYQKTMALYDAVIKKTATPIKVNMLKTRFAVKQGIQSIISSAKKPFKLNINK